MKGSKRVKGRHADYVTRRPFCVAGYFALRRARTAAASSVEQRVGFGPVDAAVGDALAVDERLAGDELLRAGDEIALDHDADDVAIAGGDLRGDVVADDGLAAIILAAVGVAEVDHDARRDAGLLHVRGGVGNAVGGVVHGLCGRRAG